MKGRMSQCPVGQCEHCEHDWDFFSKVKPAGYYCLKCGAKEDLPDAKMMEVEENYGDR